MGGRSVALVIDGHQCRLGDRETGDGQESPVSPILFSIYLSSIFKEVEEQVE